MYCVQSMYDMEIFVLIKDSKNPSGFKSYPCDAVSFSDTALASTTDDERRVFISAKLPVLAYKSRSLSGVSLSGISSVILLLARILSVTLTTDDDIGASSSENSLSISKFFDTISSPATEHLGKPASNAIH